MDRVQSLQTNSFAVGTAFLYFAECCFLPKCVSWDKVVTMYIQLQAFDRLLAVQEC